LSFGALIAQENKVGSSDDLLKDSLYVVNKVKVLNYSLKQFDHLFFEFSEKNQIQNRY
jgi:predicted AlkP superfamily pyrophosphatase or phosphodiesterase